MTGGNKKIIVLFVIALFFIFFRLYNMGNPFSTNGIDEGIHLVQARMVGEGYNLYRDLGGDQAPLAILTFSLIKGNVMAARYLSFSLFLIATFSSFFIASHLRNKKAGVFAVLMLAMDFTLLRESRLASLDMFSASLLCVSALFFIMYLDNNDWRFVAFSSLFLSLSCLSKMIAAPFAFLLTVAFFYEAIKKKKFFHFSMYVIFFTLPFLFMLLAFTPQELMNGMLFRQMSRGFNASTKLSFLLFIGPSFIYLLSLRKWDLRNKKVAFIVLWLSSLLLFIMLQGRTFQHHFAYVVFPAAILTSVVLADMPERSLKKNALLISFIAVNVFLSSFLVVTAPHDMAYDVASDIDRVTPPGSVVISGNPLVNVLADRDCPPNLTNLAYYHNLSAEPSDVIYWLEYGDVKAVVLYWHLADMDEIRTYLEESNYTLYRTVEGRGQILFDGVIPKFSEDRYTIYVQKQLLEPSP